MKEFKYKTIFSSEIKPLVSEDKDKHLALASFLDVSQFVPEIDTDKNIDLLPIAFNACVANRVNKNDDVVDTETAISMAEYFINKPINIEHDRTRVLGTILSYGFSEFGTDKPLTLDEVKDLNEPFNVTLGGVLWRVVNNKLTDVVEEASDPTSSFYKKISASWELGFDKYELVLLNDFEKNLEKAQVLANDDIDSLKGNLRALGGSGEYEGKRIYRKCIGSVLPLGIGLTENPAADVKGVATKKTKIDVCAEEEDISENENISEKIISHQQKTDVIESKDSTIMKITSINDINEETLKVIEASEVSDFIESELKKASEDFAAEKTALEDKVNAAKEEFDSLTKQHDETKEQLDQVQEALDTLQAEKIEREKLDQFNQRMSLLDDTYALSDQEREIIAADIKDLDEEGFAAYQSKMEVLLKDKNKETLAKEEEAKASEESQEEQADTEEVVASEEEAKASEEQSLEQDVVENAVDQAENAGEEIPVTTAAEEPTVKEKYKDAFGIENFEIKL